MSKEIHHKSHKNSGKTKTLENLGKPPFFMGKSWEKPYATRSVPRTARRHSTPVATKAARTPPPEKAKARRDDGDDDDDDDDGRGLGERENVENPRVIWILHE